MLFQCTKAMLDKIDVKEDALVSKDGREAFPESFKSWHVHIVTMDRRKAIVLMNNETYYPILIYGVVKQDFKNIRKLLIESITEAFRMEGIREDVVEAYIKEAGDVSFSKTATRSLTARMNNTVRDIGFWDDYIDKQSKIQRYVSMMAGRMIQSSGTSPGEGFYPIEETYECLREMCGVPRDATNVLDVDLYQLKIQLNIENHDIWRRVLVPATFSFRQLHNVIQTVFDWQNYHLHEFTVERPNDKALKMVMDDIPDTLDYFDFDRFEMARERFTPLDEVVSGNGDILYEYDFGDSWEHIITLEKTVKSKELRATFSEGAGMRPPEDVGGTGGFEEYLRIMADENHPDYPSMKMWSEAQKERELSADQVNDRLKHAISGYMYFPHYP